jgi:hypothetical protein
VTWPLRAFMRCNRYAVGAFRGVSAGLKARSPGLKSGAGTSHSLGLNRGRKKLVSEQIRDAAAEDSAEKFRTGQLPQGLKPDVYSIRVRPD